MKGAVLALKEFGLVLSLLVFALSSLFAPAAVALTKEQRALLNKNVLYYDLGCSAIDQEAANEGQAGPIFMLGDSILQGAYYGAGELGYGGLDNTLKEKGLDVKVDAQVSRSIKNTRGVRPNPINPNRSTGLEAVEMDRKYIEESGNIVVALGTNIDGSPQVYRQSLKELVSKIKAINDTASIMVVNIFSPSILDRNERNDVIRDLSKTEGFKVVDTTKETIATSDKTHPTNQGYKTYNKIISEALASTAGGANISINGPYKPKAYPGDKIGIGDAYKGNASTYGEDPSVGYDDPGDRSGSSASGISNRVPGLAVYNGGSLRGWWKVIAPNGKAGIIQQTDVGPSTSRIVDINSVAARSVFGYKAGNAFPTDQGEWKIEYVGKTKPSGAITKDTGGVGDASPLNASDQETRGSQCNCKSNENETVGASNQTSIVGKDNFEKAFNFYTQKGLGDLQAAAIVGNFAGESSMNPKITNGIGAHGIAQWYQGRRTALQAFAKGQNPPKDENDLEAQLKFSWKELSEGYKSTLEQLKKETSIDQAVINFEKTYEVSGDEGSYPRRIAYAKQVLKKYGDGGVGGNNISGKCGESTTEGENTRFVDGFPVYSQLDPRWAGKSYGSSTIARSGCAPTAMAMIITALTGKKVLPPETARYAASQGLYIPGAGSSWTIPKVLADKYNLRAVPIGKDLNKIKSTLQSGGLVIGAGAGAVPYTRGGHYIVIRGLTEDGKFKVGDSAHAGANNQAWDAATILSNTAGGSVYAVTK